MSKFKAGDRVTYSGHNNTIEYGIIIHSWLDESGNEDCYIAFLGTGGFVENKPNKPYVLRYFANSLTEWDSSILYTNDGV